jgi:hypothetical protein
MGGGRATSTNSHEYTDGPAYLLVFYDGLNDGLGEGEGLGDGLGDGLGGV